MSGGDEVPLDDLARANALYEAYEARRDDGTAESEGVFLAKHEELRELLEDLLAGGKTRPLPDQEPSGSRSGATEQRLTRLRSGSPAAHDRYSKREEVARGGMGAILRVYDEHLARTSAMKVMLGGEKGEVAATTTAADPQVLERFLDEAQITGQLDHPGVVPVHELGIDSQGRVYFTMRLVRGRTAAEVFEQAREGKDGWTQTRALDVILKICDTLAFAHSKGVIHRDIKPANVMVGRFGEVYVMDWGLAKVLGESDKRDLRIRPQTATLSRVHTPRTDEVESAPDSPLVTMDGAVVGTPSYMSPEQAEGRVEDLGVPSDVYAVGALLYALLTGWQPYLAPGTAASPYTVLNAVRNGPPKPVHEIDPSVPAELVSICEKAMARDPGARYRDTRGLGEDVRAYLENRAVRAYRTGALVELRLWVRRNRQIAVALAATILMVLGGAVWIAYVQRQAKNQIDLVADAASQASEGRRLVVASQNILKQDPTLALLLALEAEARHPGPEANGALVDAMLAAPRHRVHATSRPPQFPLFRHDARVVSRCDPCTLDGRKLVLLDGGSTGRIVDAMTGETIAPLQGHGSVITTACFDGTGRYVVTGSLDRTARVWNSATGAETARLSGHEGPVSVAYFNADASLVFTQSGDRTSRVWRASDGRQLLRLDRTDVFMPLRGDYLIVGGEKKMSVLDARTGTQRATLPGWGAAVMALAKPLGYFPPSACLTGHRIVSTGSRRLAVWSAETGERIAVISYRELHGSGGRYSVAGLAFSPDGTRVLAYPSDEEPARLWTVDSQRVVDTLRGRPREIAWARFAADGRILVASADGTLGIWDANGETELRRLQVGDEALTDARLGEDGAWLVTTEPDGTVTRWDLAPDAQLGDFKPEGEVLCLSRTGRFVLAAEKGSPPVVHDVARATASNPAASDAAIEIGGQARYGVLSADGTRALVTGLYESLVWNVQTGQGPGRPIRHEYNLPPPVFARDGSRVVLCQSQTIGIWDTRSGKLQDLIRTRRPSAHEVRGVAAHLHAGIVVTWETEQFAAMALPRSGLLPTFRLLIRGWSSREGRLAWEVAPADLDASGGGSPELSPDGQIVAFYSDVSNPGSPVAVLEAATGRLIKMLQDDGPTGTGARLELVGSRPRFDPSGRVLATVDADRAIRIWDVKTWRLEHKARRERDVKDIVFAHTKAMLASFSDRTVHLWDFERGLGEVFGVRLSEDVTVKSVAFTVDDQTLVVLSSDGSVRRVPTDPPRVARARTPRALTPPERHQYALSTNADDDARRLVDGLFDRLLTPARVIEHVRDMTELDPTTRESAIQFARYWNGYPRLIESSLETTRRAGLDPEGYRGALRRAEAAVRLHPLIANALTAAAAAHYRLGNYEAALDCLDFPEQVFGPGKFWFFEPIDVTQVALQTLCEHKLGRRSKENRVFWRTIQKSRVPLDSNQFWQEAKTALAGK